MTEESIVGVALRIGPLTVSLPRLKRHGDVMREMGKQGFNYIAGPEDQGFITSSGRFVDRFEGAAIAIRAAQINKLRYPPYLYSEDLW